VHAAALQAVAPKDPAKAVRNAALVGDMGRQALTELREMLGVLRSGDALVAPRAGQVPLASVGRAAAAAAVVVAEEGPRLGEVEALVAQSREAGMTVELGLAHGARHHAIVEDVVVAAEARGQGIGEAMMRFAMQRCAERRCYKLALSSHLRREEAHRFYERLGFTKHGYSFLVA
jgi:GNAT superfamily N-acetyltransferase